MWWYGVLVCAFLAAEPAPKPTKAERAAQREREAHERDVWQVLNNTPYPFAYGEAVLAGRDERIQQAHNNLLAHEKARPKGDPGNSQWAGTRNKLKISWQLRKRGRLGQAPEPAYIGPTFSKVGDCGYIANMEVIDVRDSSELLVRVGHSKTVGLTFATRLDGTRGSLSQPVYEQVWSGEGRVTNFPTDDEHRVSKAYHGIYQLVKAGNSGYELKYLGCRGDASTKRPKK